MKNKLIEWIREILVKTILPIRKKKTEILSKFRFSIAFRITLNYAKLFLLYGTIFLFAFSLIYLFERGYRYETVIESYMNDFDGNKVMDEDEIAFLRNHGYEVEIKNEDGASLYSNIGFQLEDKQLIFHRIYYSTKYPGNTLMVRHYETVSIHQEIYTYIFQYNLTDDYNQLLSLLWKVALLYVLFCIIITYRGKKENVKLLEPIEEMSQLATSLNVNNLGSERINVEGTQNELRDLAVLINEMLDRIELSYESQKQFVSDASHELRTPIAVIQGYGNMLKRWGAKDEEVLAESIEAINNEAKSMQDLVEKLLFLSRHDKKTLKLDKKRFHMGPVIEDMVKETKLVAKNRVILSPVIQDVTVYGDAQALKQAIRVFIDNAIKYTKDGDKITISCENHHGDCVITVADTGIGMNKKDMDHIFQRFYRSDTVRNQNISGHGLGLSLAKLIILAHVGRIKVRSQFTVGTSFTVTIPMKNQ